METKFTPGPWRVQRQFGKWVIGPNPERDGVPAVEIAGRPTDAEKESVANLIASAPDLYAALGELLCAYAPQADETAKREGEGALHTAVRLARAALKKARGEA